jgi:hypothetical protein
MRKMTALHVVIFLVISSVMQVVAHRHPVHHRTDSFLKLGIIRAHLPEASRSRRIVGKMKPQPSHVLVAPRSPRIKAHRACESGDLHTTYDYSMHQGPSTASGAWQVLDTTWEGYGGYGRAYEAPREVQDRWARHYFDANGYTAWAASRRCWGG